MQPRWKMLMQLPVAWIDRQKEVVWVIVKVDEYSESNVSVTTRWVMHVDKHSLIEREQFWLYVARYSRVVNHLLIHVNYLSTSPNVLWTTWFDLVFLGSGLVIKDFGLGPLIRSGYSENKIPAEEPWNSADKRWRERGVMNGEHGWWSLNKHFLLFSLFPFQCFSVLSSFRKHKTCKQVCVILILILVILPLLLLLMTIEGIIIVSY